jgi:pimeloyl-ACP methyl ester carboxylesterase
MNSIRQADGRKIAYAFHTPLERAERPPLVLLHGFCADSSIWEAVRAFLPDIRILTVDLPGFGASDLPASPGMAGYVESVCAVLDALELERVVLVGHSMGGYVALELADRQPERLLGLGLVHAHPFTDAPERILHRRRAIAALQEGKKDLYVSQLYAGLFAPNFIQSQPDVVDGMIAMGRRQSTEGLIAAVQGMIDRKEHLEVLDRLQVPMLLLMGKEDALIPRMWVRDMIQRPALADAHLLPGVGHLSMVETPRHCSDLIRSFYQYCLER